MSSIVLEISGIFARILELGSLGTQPTQAQQDEMRELVRRGKELTLDFFRDNEQLKSQVTLLEKQKLEAEQRSSSTKIVIENDELKAEVQYLNKRIAELESSSSTFRRRYEDVEKRNMALSNVYVASSQLHATLDFTEVVKTAKEILWNLVASPVFAIFLKDEKSSDLILVGGEGVDGRFVGDRLQNPSGLIMETLEDGELHLVEGQIKGDPLACIPLKVKGRGVVGLVVVYEVEQHKGGLSETDKELFELLAVQTATAMTSSRVYTETLKKLRSMESFLNLIKPS
jgi:hypothetical protein